MSGDDDLASLATAVKARREFLQLTIEEAAAAAAVVENTVIRVEAGKRARGLSYAGIDRALGWPPGTCRAILAGTPAPPNEDGTKPATPSPGDPYDRHIAALLEEADRVEADVDLPLDERREYSANLRAEAAMIRRIQEARRTGQTRSETA